jgi:hypothetical protein
MKPFIVWIGYLSWCCWCYCGAALEVAKTNNKKNHLRLKQNGRHRRIEWLVSRQQVDSLSDFEQVELSKLRALGDPYDAGLFSTAHQQFKASHNQAFCRLAARATHVFYLDGDDGATTQALLLQQQQQQLNQQNAQIQDQQLYTCNEYNDTAQALVTKYSNNHHQFHCICGQAQHVL